MSKKKELLWMHSRPTCDAGFYNKYEAAILNVYDYKASFVIEELVCDERGRYRLFLDQFLLSEYDSKDLGIYATVKDACAAADEEYSNVHTLLSSQL